MISPSPFPFLHTERVRGDVGNATRLRGRLLCTTAGAVLSTVLASSTAVFANPGGGVVVNGQATIQSGGSTVTVNETSQNAIINTERTRVTRAPLTTRRGAGFAWPHGSKRPRSR